MCMLCGISGQLGSPQPYSGCQHLSCTELQPDFTAEGGDFWVQSEDPCMWLFLFGVQVNWKWKNLRVFEGWGADLMDLIETVDEPLNSNFLNACGRADLNSWVADDQKENLLTVCLIRATSRHIQSITPQSRWALSRLIILWSVMFFCTHSSLHASIYLHFLLLCQRLLAVHSPDNHTSFHAGVNHLHVTLLALLLLRYFNSGTLWWSRDKSVRVKKWIWTGRSH